jgi:rRNA maturation RNase YbeY
MLDIVVSNGRREKRMSKKAVHRTVSFVLKKEKVSRGKISLVFVDDNAIKKINSKYLGHRRATDVITFPIEVLPSLEAEIYINVKQARRQARQYRVSIANELTRLIVHGVLHAVGYDDRRTNQRKEMFEIQERYVGLCFRNRRAI